MEIAWIVASTARARAIRAIWSLAIDTPTGIDVRLAPVGPFAPDAPEDHIVEAIGDGRRLTGVIGRDMA